MKPLVGKRRRTGRLMVVSVRCCCLFSLSMSLWSVCLFCLVFFFHLFVHSFLCSLHFLCYLVLLWLPFFDIDAFIGVVFVCLFVC